MEQNNSLLKPYKSIGVFLDDKQGCLYHSGEKIFIAYSCYNSFKIYGLPDLKVKLLGPHLENQITCLQGINEYLFVSSLNKIYKFKFYHIEEIIEDHSYDIQSMILIGGNYLISSDVKNQIVIRDVKLNNIVQVLLSQFQIIKIIHPITYLNKILLVGQNNVELWNFITKKKLYDFSHNFKDQIITCTQQSPIIDIVVFGCQSGKIIFLNIKQDKILFQFQQQNPILCLAFSHSDIPLLATGDQQGTINFWDLNEKSIFSNIKQAHNGPITSLNFMQNELILMSGSGEDNSLNQWTYDENSEFKFANTRKRHGITSPIQKMRFYGENSNHLIVSTFKENNELFDISLLNECMSIKYSAKQNKQMVKKQYNTEKLLNMSKIIDFAFSLNREQDWANILTSHEYSDRPSLWSGDSKSIFKQNVYIFADNQQELMENVQTSCVDVSMCGNFGVIGFSNGIISKINMQSGKFQSHFNTHKCKITSLFIDYSNSYLIACDEKGLLIKYDFLAGIIHEQVQLQQSVSYMKQSNFSNLFLMILDDFQVQVWDISKLKKVRQFIGHTNTVNDAFFTNDNKFVFSCSKDKTLKIWEILSGRLINNLNLQHAIQTMDISKDGEMIASSFENQKEINLWHNLVYMKPWGLDGGDVIFKSEIKQNQGRRIYQKKQNIQIEEEKENLFQVEQCQQNLLQYTDLKKGNFMPLVYLDLIKEKNKPKNMKQMDVKIPFFLDFNKKDEIQKNLQKDFIKFNQEQSKIIQDQKDQYMDNLGTQMEKYIIQQQCENELFNYLKTLTPSQFDYEFRKNLFDNQESLQKILKFFKCIFQQNNDFDLKQIYFQITYDQIIENQQCQNILNEILIIIKNQWQQLDDKFLENICLLENFAKIQS